MDATGSASGVSLEAQVAVLLLILFCLREQAPVVAFHNPAIAFPCLSYIFLKYTQYKIHTI